MSRFSIANSLLYKQRYALGYAAIAIIVIILLTTASLYIPGGISSREMTAVVKSASTSVTHFTPDMIVNLPYHLLQKTGFVFFGVSDLTIKLPTIIIAFTSIVGMLLLLNVWFRRNVAVLAALVAITTGPFLLAAQAGTPGILYIFWPVWILLAASMISRGARLRLFWKILLFIVIAMSLYTPLSIYVLIALVSAVVLHPRLRYIIKNLSISRVGIAVVIGTILMVPLFYSIYQHPTIILTLLGIPNSIDIMANIEQLYRQYFLFNEPSNGLIMTPVYELASILLVALGVYQVVTAKYTARSYILSAWLVMLIPVLLINPNLVNVTFVPFLLLIGYGINFLIYSWYQLFPKNPYARVAGLVPLTIFIVSLTLSGVDRFVYGYLYSPGSAPAVTKDLSILHANISNQDSQVILQTGSQDEQYFYESALRFNKNWPITSIVSSAQISTSQDTVFATHQAHKNNRTKDTTYPITKIFTDSSKVNADRFYVYKNTAE